MNPRVLGKAGRALLPVQAKSWRRRRSSSAQRRAAHPGQDARYLREVCAGPSAPYIQYCGWSLREVEGAMTWKGMLAAAAASGGNPARSLVPASRPASVHPLHDRLSHFDYWGPLDYTPRSR